MATKVFNFKVGDPVWVIINEAVQETLQVLTTCPLSWGFLDDKYGFPAKIVEINDFNCLVRFFGDIFCKGRFSIVKQNLIPYECREGEFVVILQEAPFEGQANKALGQIEDYISKRFDYPTSAKVKTGKPIENENNAKLPSVPKVPNRPALGSNPATRPQKQPQQTTPYSGTKGVNFELEVGDPVWVIINEDVKEELQPATKFRLSWRHLGRKYGLPAKIFQVNQTNCIVRFFGDIFMESYDPFHPSSIRPMNFSILKKNLVPYVDHKIQSIKVFKGKPFLEGNDIKAIKEVEEYILKRPKCKCVNCLENR